jgi:hypothetical protein
MSLAQSYWTWLSQSSSTNRDDRLVAERSSSVHLEVLDVISASADQADDLLSALLSEPTEFNQWHIETLMSGILEEISENYGEGFFDQSKALSTPRGQELLAFWKRRTDHR